jgi:hypothetical protein
MLQLHQQVRMAAILTLFIVRNYNYEGKVASYGINPYQA